MRFSASSSPARDGMAPDDCACRFAISSSVPSLNRNTASENSSTISCRLRQQLQVFLSISIGGVEGECGISDEDRASNKAFTGEKIECARL